MATVATNGVGRIGRSERLLAGVPGPSLARSRVVIAGGGVAGLEAVLALRDLLGDRVEMTLVSPEREFVYRPMAVAAPFARGHAQRHRLADIANRLQVRLVRRWPGAGGRSLAQRDHRGGRHPDVRRPRGRGGGRVGTGVRPGTDLDAGVRRRRLRWAAGRPRSGLQQARGVRGARRRLLAAARLRARAYDGVGRLRDGPGRCRDHGVHP